MTIAYETRAKLAANGYDCVPLVGKRPVLPGWQKKTGATPEDFNHWDIQPSRATNTGLNSPRTPGIDLDITNPEAATMLGDAVRDWFDGRGVADPHRASAETADPVSHQCAVQQDRARVPGPGRQIAEAKTAAH